jgi:hypothetical protein
MKTKIVSVLASIICGAVLGEALVGSNALAICYRNPLQGITCSDNCLLSVYWCVNYNSGSTWSSYYFDNTPGGNGVSNPSGSGQNCVTSSASDVSGDNYHFYFASQSNAQCNCLTSNGSGTNLYILQTGGAATGYSTQNSTFMTDTCTGGSS